MGGTTPCILIVLGSSPTLTSFKKIKLNRIQDKREIVVKNQPIRPPSGLIKRSQVSPLNGRDSSNIGKGVTPWADASYVNIIYDGVTDVSGCRSGGGLRLHATSSYKEKTEKRHS